MFSRAELARDFRALGIRPGDTVMLHASVRAVGPVAGGPDQIHLALKDALTPDGTLLMYASCPDLYDDVGRGGLSAETERDVREKLPPFDAQTARAQRDNGILVEFLRTFPDSRVNDHVARFVTWGAHATHLLSEQPWDWAFGAGSALERFHHLDGRILLLGCDHDTVTFLHYAEHVIDFPGKRIAAFEVPVLEDGHRVWRPMREVNTSSSGAHAHWPDRFFARIVATYLARFETPRGRVGDADCRVLEARPLFELARELMPAIAADRAATSRLAEEPAIRD